MNPTAGVQERPVETQAPPSQDTPVAHAFPQPPQLLGSVWVFAQLLPHKVPPLGQVQVPLVQVCPVAHNAPHFPQLLASVCVSVQPLLQSVPPEGQAQAFPTQLPEQQSAPTLHAAPGAVQAAQVPLWQMFEQHSLASVQPVPSSWQASQLPW